MADLLTPPEEATAAVADYLRQNFPDLLIEHTWDPRITSERFTLFTKGHDPIVHSVNVSREFLQDCSASTVSRVLKAYEVIAMMKKNGKKPVTVTAHYAIDV